MADFHQSGPVLTLPLLSDESAEKLEADLSAWTAERPLALLLPCHVRDLDSPALAGIAATLRDIPWIAHTVIGLDGAEDHHEARARALFAALPGSVEVLRMPAGREGKGWNLHACAARVLARGTAFAAAMHDCDIRTYSRGFLARLCWPVLHPAAGLHACKGYYARAAGQLHGRLFRLFFQPLLRAWTDCFPPGLSSASAPHRFYMTYKPHESYPSALPPPSPAAAWLAFLQSLRYPLSGELCVRTATLRRLTFDPGWGIEIRLLHSLYHTLASHEICQAELCTAYDHKHQDAAGLIRMAEEVARTLLETLGEEGPAPSFDATAPDALTSSYTVHIATALRTSRLTAAFNGLHYDDSGETALAARFPDALRRSFTTPLSGADPITLPPFDVSPGTPASLLSSPD